VASTSTASGGRTAANSVHSWYIRSRGFTNTENATASCQPIRVRANRQAMTAKANEKSPQSAIDTA
jgi:hypothetical protein